MSRLTIKSSLWGIVASFGMFGFYLATMYLAMPIREVWINFSYTWYLIIGLVLGFGIQIGLWVYAKNCMAGHSHSSMPAASSAMSGTAMVACCAHHIAEVLPILGISGAAIFLAQYQKPFLVLGLSINLFGIAYMLHLLNKHRKDKIYE